MIRTNLATRPFYNIRTVQVGLLVAAVVVAAVTAYNVVEIIRLVSNQRTLGAQAQAAEREAAALRAEAAQTMARIDAKEVEVVAKAAREANEVIDRRAFSWTALFTRLEATLPADVRITRLTPLRDSEELQLGVQARSIEDLDAFIEALEMTGAFQDVLATSEVTMENDTIEATLRARYVQPQRDAEVRQ